MQRQVRELNVLNGKFAPEALDKLDAVLLQADSVDLEAWNLAQRIGVTDPEADQILEALATEGLFTKRTLKRCRIEQCRAELEEEDIIRAVCPSCGSPFPRTEEPFETVDIFSLGRRRSRDVSWVITIHGMNTWGPWQQQLQWLMDLTYLRTIPFANWKYGKVLFTPVVWFLRKRLVRQFIRRFCRYEAEVSQKRGAFGEPDIIAHSFGTWLIGHALLADPDLRVGHIILTGCILPPDFNWKLLVDRGQVKGILNHYGRRDFWARIAVRCIPGSGPSGRIGFLPPTGNYLYNVAEQFGHSDFFSQDNLEKRYKDLWEPFLRDRIKQRESAENLHADCSGWHLPPLMLRAPLFPALAIGVPTSVAIILTLLLT